MLTNDEINLLCIYESSTRLGLITELVEMREHLDTDEIGLLSLADSALGKLQAMNDTEFYALELYPDYDTESIWR